MSELTPEQTKLQQEIQTNVDAIKFYRTHLRWAGLAATAIGWFAHIPTVVLIGFSVYLLSFVCTLVAMEAITILVWDRSDEPKKEEKTEE